MRKSLSLLIVLLLLAACPAALARTYAREHVFTVEYPDNWEVDEESYLSENDEYYSWLADLYGDGRTVVLSMEKLEGWEGFSLFSAGEDERAEYRDDFLADFAENNPSYEGELYDSTGCVPFETFLLSEEKTNYYYATTVASGTEICFYLYREDGTIAEADRDALNGIVKSFTPIQ